jgi:hypothetical protein
MLNSNTFFNSTRLNVVKVDSNVIITIRSALLMIETKGV